MQLERMPSQSRLTIVPMTLKDAMLLCARLHRTHKPPQGGLFAIGVMDAAEVIRGVAIVGRPLARAKQDGWTAEVVRVTTDGCENACSALYAACWRACRAMGYQRLGTYILDHEPGTSVRAAGWKEIGKTRAQSWHRGSRPRIDEQPLQQKIRWEISV